MNLQHLSIQVYVFQKKLALMSLPQQDPHGHQEAVFSKEEHYSCA